MTANENGEFKVEGLVPEHDPIGDIVIEFPEILKPKITMAGKIEYAAADTIPLNSKLNMEGYVNEENNGIKTVIDNQDGHLTVAEKLVEEDTSLPISVPGPTTEIYQGALTGDSEESVDITITANGTFKITIDSVEYTSSGSHTLKIVYNNSTELVNAEKEFPADSHILNSLSFEKKHMSGEESITSVKLEGSGFTASGVRIIFEEEATEKESEAVIVPTIQVTNVSVTKTGYKYTIDTLDEGILLYLTGYIHSDNNGIKKVESDDGTTITIVSDVPFSEEKVFSEKGALATVAGLEFAPETININEEGHLVGTGFLALKEKQLFIEGAGIFIGGTTDQLQYNFTDLSANGLARIRMIEDEIIILDKRDLPVDLPIGEKYVFTPDSDEEIREKTIRIYLGKFTKTYPVGHELYNKVSHCYELKMTNDDGNTFTEYCRGNLLNTLELGLPSQEKATMNVATVAQETESATTTPMNWTVKEPRMEEIVSTPSDIIRCRISGLDDQGMATLWTDATLSINNNVAASYALGSLASVYTAQGNFEVKLSGQVYFTSYDVFEVIKGNCTVSGDLFFFNSDGGLFIDIPTGTLSDGSRDYQNNEKVKVSLELTAYGDQAFGYSISSTMFPYIPSDKAEICK